jgi:hypothetical protein
VTHFGIGPRKKAEVMRILWANGVPQNKFDVAGNQDLYEEAVMKGSCPYLYAWDGTKYVFITDFLAASPLGLKVDETDYAWIDPEDVTKIRGDQLRPKDGEYILQMTEELWEALYLDEAELLVVDHPGDVEVFCNEKFTPPPYPDRHIHAVSDLRLPAGARDTEGRDVLADLREVDDRYVVDFHRPHYQGIVTPHTLTLDLGDLKDARRIRLFFTGWIHWTDTSINVAIGQNESLTTHPPKLSVPDGKGGWKVVLPWMGYPGGKPKTVVHELTGQFVGDDYRVKIETDFEIYWDQVLLSTQEEESPTRVTSLRPKGADVHYRGFSRMWKPTQYGPHLYDYQQTTRENRWRDLEGKCTRYGDVLELVESWDDKMVVLQAGDELTLRFDATAVPELPEGWRRDFLLRSVGYDKDGDLNTTHSQTVGPLPFRGMSGYPYGPDEAYPTDPEHQEYLKTYQTRETGQDGFRAYLRNREPLFNRSRGPGR